MKNIYSFSLLCVPVLLLIGGILFFVSSQNETTPRTNLAQEQEVIPTSPPESLEQEDRLSPEKQQQLNKIKQIYTKQENAYHTTVVNILRKYNSNFSENDEKSLLTIIEASSGAQDFTRAAKETLNMSFLQTDIRKMLELKETLSEEKQLETRRLELFGEKNVQDLDIKTQRLIELSVKDTFRQNTTLSTQDIIKISKQVAFKLFHEDSYLLKYESFEKQQTLLIDTLSLCLEAVESLSLLEKQTLIILAVEDISQLKILLPKQAAPEENKVSFIPTPLIFESLQKLGFFLFPRAHASETAPLTPEQQEIFILKTEIFIGRILQESIETEIRYNKDELSQEEYNIIIEENLIQLEELVILQNSILNDSNALTLDDIQRFNLGAYVDDSIAIQDLPVLAYIQNKTGHIVIYNLNGSSKLGDENMSLYSGYAIETLSDSTLTLIFSDESILRLDPLSKVSISTPVGLSINVAVEKGTLWTRVLKPLLSGDIFTIESDTVSLGVRGTSLALTKNPDDTQVIHIVDSYTSDGSPSVILTDATGMQSAVASGKKISIDASGNTSLQDISRTELFMQQPQIIESLREDLTYLSLLIDDRKRGFYNTPIISRNDSESFLQKIIGELEVSLPQAAEIPYIITNKELAGEVVGTGSIYHLIKQDDLITAIKNNATGNTTAKVQTIRDFDMQALEDNLGNKREIEKRFDYNITQDIISENTFTSNQLKEIFLGFPIKIIQDDSRLLSEVKQSLSINNGASIITEDISLPASLSGVIIKWESTQSSIISKTGRVSPQKNDTSAILTAYLELGNLSTTKDFALTVVRQEPTDSEQLQSALDILTNYINSTAQGKFTNMLTLPDFLAEGSITPKITWTGSTLVNIDGTTNRPPFREPPNEYESTTVQVRLEHPTTPSISLGYYYTIGIQRKSEEETIKDCTGVPLGLPTNVFIGVECFELVASAEYDAPGDIDLRTITGALLAKSSANVNLSTCSLSSTGNCGWYNENAIASMYNYEFNKIYDFDKEKSWISYDGESGIVIDNEDDPYLPPDLVVPDFLSYDLSSLDLGEDWAIEMSVRGEDLKRSGTEWYYIFASPSSNGGNFAINSKNKKLRFIYSGISANETNTSLIPNDYYKITFTPEIHFIEGFGVIQSNNTALILADTIKIGSALDNLDQWNGIINYLKIYKKN